VAWRLGRKGSHLGREGNRFKNCEAVAKMPQMPISAVGEWEGVSGLGTAGDRSRCIAKVCEPLDNSAKLRKSLVV
jgi:hypothetical protein